MTWLRSGDNAYLDPRITQVRALRPDVPGVVLMVRGFMWSVASHAAQFKTEYFVNLGACWEIGQESTEMMLDLCQQVGLLTPVEMDGLKGFRIVEDSDFVHIKSQEAIDREKNRRNDNRDQNLKWAVVFRDGDNCRWCGKRLHWTGKISNAKATLDHLIPGEKGTVETMVVACVTCNSARQDDSDGSWGRANELLPVPASPYYSPHSRKWLVTYGHLAAEEESESKKDSSGALTSDATPAAVSSFTDKDASADVIPGRHSSASAGFPMGDPATTDHRGSAGPSAENQSLDSEMIPGRLAPASAGFPMGDPATTDHRGSAGLSDVLSSSPDGRMIPGRHSSASAGFPMGDPGRHSSASEGLRPNSISDQTEHESGVSHQTSPSLSPDSVRTRKRQGPPKSEFAGTGRDGTGRDGTGRDWTGQDGEQSVSRRRKRR